MSSAKHTPSSASAFRDELQKLMPGYSWTVHKQPKYRDIPQDTLPLKATGIQSSGSNRLSTLEVTRRPEGARVTYEAKSAGYGTRARWLHENKDGTLARALRGLQEHYRATAATYRSHEQALQQGRALPIEGGAA
jgi:hypothetical protein